ncbi:hypothetical protein [Streptomyces sp. Wb2n-11]|uniref:hypothetical protein n=1 Tax=Streptomyces sp. Wb2n-11 TaxID=1030533 RepID=UPI000AF4427E|nr:hypothetical protein [Streptomyces sp. Wb2n-11]
MAKADAQEPTTELLVTPETWPYIAGTPRHKALNAWLADNGIDPADVSVDEPLSIITTPDGTQAIHHTVHLRNATGHRYVTPESPNQPASEARSTPLKTRPPQPKRSDITTLALLTAIDDHATREVPLGKYRWELPGAWWILGTAYPEKVVTAAYIREDDRGHLECGVSLRTSWLTDKGHAKLAELRVKGTG